MARWTDEQIREGMLHEDLYARSHAFETLAESRSAKAETAKQFFRAVEKFGRTSAFRFHSPAENLALDDEGAARLLEELSSRFHKPAEADYFNSLSDWLATADEAFLVRNREAILSAPRLAKNGRLEIEAKLKLSLLDNEALWAKLKAIPAEQVGEEYNREAHRVAKRCIALLAGRGFPAPEVVLSHIPSAYFEEPADDLALWMGIHAIELAGRLRLREAAPAIAKLLSQADDDFTTEEGKHALIRIGGDETMDALLAATDGAREHFATYALGILETIRTDRSLERIIGYPDISPLDEFSVLALAGQFSDAANKRLLELARDYPDDRLVRESVLPVAMLMGMTFPERDEWLEAKRSRYAEMDRRHEMLMRIMDKPIRRSAPVAEPLPAPIQKSAAGRNDPCPCGSGKKYKKCCLNK